ncbi:MAG: hypothetical protein FWC94_06440 [Bacteroidales bacterium]|nr:hypothetical protein [Bacteroidales bacterium]
MPAGTCGLAKWHSPLRQTIGSKPPVVSGRLAKFCENPRSAEASRLSRTYASRLCLR